MLANTNILYLSKNEEKKDETDFGWKITKLDKASTDFSAEATAAEKLKGEVSNLYVFDTYREKFQFAVDHLKGTITLWDDKLKPSLIRSGNRLRAFCDTYTTYYKELHAYFNGDPTSDKNIILGYLDEIKETEKNATKAINDTAKKTKTYVDSLNEDKDNLNAKVIPEITTLFKTEDIELESLRTKIELSESNIAALEKQYITAVWGAGAAGAGLTLTIIVSGLKKGGSKFGAKVGGKLLTKITGKLGPRVTGLIGKGLAVITIITTLTEIAGLATSLYYIVNISKKISEENANLTNFKIQETQLQTNVANLKSMQSIFTKVTQQTGDTYNQFSKFKDTWTDITTKFEIMESSLKTVDTKARADTVMFMRSALKDMNEKFIILAKKLSNSGMGLNLTINEEVKFIEGEDSNITQTIFTPRIKIPAQLYSSYNNLVYI